MWRMLKCFADLVSLRPVLHQVSVSSWWSITLSGDISGSGQRRLLWVTHRRIINTPPDWSEVAGGVIVLLLVERWRSRTLHLSLRPGVSRATDTDPADFLRYHRRAGGHTGAGDTPRAARHGNSYTLVWWWQSNIVSFVKSSSSSTGSVLMTLSEKPDTPHWWPLREVGAGAVFSWKLNSKLESPSRH